MDDRVHRLEKYWIESDRCASTIQHGSVSWTVVIQEDPRTNHLYHGDLQWKAERALRSGKLPRTDCFLFLNAKNCETEDIAVFTDDEAAGMPTSVVLKGKKRGNLAWNKREVG